MRDSKEQILSPIFGGSGIGYDPSKIKQLRLLVNCKAESYEFVTTKKIIFFPDINTNIHTDNTHKQDHD